MLTYCSKYRIGTADTSLSPVQNIKKSKMLAHCSGHRVDTDDTSLSPVQVIKENSVSERQKCSHTVLGTALAPLKPLFRLSDLKK